MVGTTAKIRVLFVDDQTEGLEQVRRLIRKKATEWSMSFAADAKTALEELEASRFDVILTGHLDLPIDGPELLSCVERRWPHIGRLLLARSVPVPHEMAAVHAFLLVPVEDELVCDVVEELASAAHDATRQGTVVYS
jgi:DNA-binding NtrC family response regulator